MSTFIYMISFILLIFIIKVQSSYYVYTYDNGSNDDDNDEHCCLVRLGDDFCLGKPLTRSLIEVNKECQRLNRNEKNKNSFKKIVRRLNVETSKKFGDKILIQLKNSLDKTLLDNDLVCLTTTNNNINLEKCFVKLTIKKQKNQNQNETTDDDESDDENQIHHVQVIEPVKIRKGHGLSVRETYELNLTDFRATTRQQRECWSWYRKHTKNIFNHPIKSKKSCISFTKNQKKCFQELFYKKTNTNTKNSITIGSKLYCENNQQQTKLLGYHLSSEICFLTHYQIYLEHKFTDFVSLSDINKNKYILQFISNNTKLTNEFQADCHDKNTLDDIKKSFEEEEEAEPIAVDENPSSEN